MKICVYIVTRAQTLNPPDETIKQTLHKMGYQNIEQVRLGRYFEFEVDDSLSEAEWRERISEVLRRPLTGFPNPVIEDWRMEVAP